MERIQLLVRLAVASCFLSVSSAALAQPVDENLWVTDGPVHAVLHRAGTIYVGGAFARVGPPTGGGVPVDIAGGTLPASFPKVSGSVYAVVSDGGSGWYIGGDFVGVGGVARSGLAHLAADLTVSSWNPDVGGVPGQTAVRALAVRGSTVYAGGDFSTVGGQARNNIALLDAATGAALSWNPDANGTVHALLVRQVGAVPVLYVGGSFTQIGAATRNRIAAFDPLFGALTTFNPNADGTVYALAGLAFGNELWAGGDFNVMSGETVSHLAGINVHTGVGTPGPSPSGPVYALAFDGGTLNLYVGGAFNWFGGQFRNNLGAIYVGNDGPALPWNPNANGPVRSLTLSGSTVFAGGDFTTMGGTGRNHLSALHASTAALSSWNPNTNGSVRALAMNASSSIFAGGDFRSIGGLTRGNLAAFDAATGQPTAWNPIANNTVYALAAIGSNVYAGGDFTTMGGLPRSRIAAMDATSGAVAGWNPNANNTVFALVADGSTVYAAGRVTIIGGKVRKRLAALEAATGLATDWNPSVNSNIYDKVLALAVDGSTVYAGGVFSAVGGQTRNNLVAVDATTGLVTAWNPNVNAPVSALAASGSTVYAGGEFSAAGGQARSHLAALDAATGLATAWNPGANGIVDALLLHGAVLYTGGDFTTIGGATRNRLAALDATTGVPSAVWDANAKDAVYGLAVGGASVYAGGAFRGMAETPQSFIAAIAAAPNATSVDAAAPSLAALSFRSNPARDRLTVLFSLPDAAPARLELFDVSGRSIEARDVGAMGAGSHAVTLGDRSTLSPGIYMLRLTRGGRGVTARAAVLR